MSRRCTTSASANIARTRCHGSRAVRRAAGHAGQAGGLVGHQQGRVGAGSRRVFHEPGASAGNSLTRAPRWPSSRSRPATPNPLPEQRRGEARPNSPSWLEAPMNTELTALTRPRIAFGRFQLHQRLADHHADHVGRAGDGEHHDRQREPVPRARSHGRRAETPTASSTVPARRRIGQRRQQQQRPAPTAGAAQQAQAPGPVCRMSRRTSAGSAVSAAEQHGKTGPARSRQHHAAAKQDEAHAGQQRLSVVRATRPARARSAAPAPARQRARSRAAQLAVNRRRAGPRRRTPPIARPAMMAMHRQTEGQRARQMHRSRHQQRDRLLRQRHLEGAAGADGDGPSSSDAAGEALPSPAQQQRDGATAAPCRRAGMRARWPAVERMAGHQGQRQRGRNCISPTRAEIPGAGGESARICQPIATISIWLAAVPANRANQKRMNAGWRSSESLNGAVPPACAPRRAGARRACRPAWRRQSSGGRARRRSAGCRGHQRQHRPSSRLAHLARPRRLAERGAVAEQQRGLGRSRP